MSITAKKLASKLNISESAVSFALNGKPGVSTETRNQIISAAHKYGYDFSKIKSKPFLSKKLLFLVYRKHGAIVCDTPFFTTLSESVLERVRESGYKITTQYIYASDNLQEEIEYLIKDDYCGILLLGTEMHKDDFLQIKFPKMPIVVLDTYFNSLNFDCVLINNREGAYQATNQLIHKLHAQPGHLKSSYNIYNFDERQVGFENALKDSGMSRKTTITHYLSPSIDGAYADMKNLLLQNVDIARCYFADNDLIAVGAMRAFKEAGYKIPGDVAFIAFDNTPFCDYIDPPLTTVNVPIKYMCQTAVERLLNVVESNKFMPLKIEVNTSIIKRKSI